MDDPELAARLAHHAGRILLAIRASGLLKGKPLGQAGDEAANRFLCQAIAQQRPEDGLLSEESADTEERLGKERVWIIDPVDGTREFGEGRSDWAVHVGLSIGGVAQIGAVALPALDLVLRSDQPALLPKAPATPRMVVSRSRPPTQALDVAKSLGAEVVPMGSAGAKAMAVVRSEAEIYLHAGGQHQWDNCAPVAVAAAHGLHVSRIDGTPLIYNKRETYVPDLLICRSDIAERVLAEIAALTR